SARRPPPACALSRGSPGLAQRRPVVVGPRALARGHVGRSSAELLSMRGREHVAQHSLADRYGTAESARRPPPACALSRGSPGLAQRRPVVVGPGAQARGLVGRSSAELLSRRGREHVAQNSLADRYGTAESARRPPP